MWKAWHGILIAVTHLWYTVLRSSIVVFYAGERFGKNMIMELLPSFQASLEDGTVQGFDTRVVKSDSKPSFTLRAHDEAVCSISYNPSVPNVCMYVCVYICLYF